MTCKLICVSDGRSSPLHLIRSSEQQGSDLLKVEFIKVSTCPTADSLDPFKP